MITIDASRAISKLQEAANRTATLPWLQAGQIVISSIHHNFDVGGRYSEGSPIGGGRKWKARKQAKPWPILQKTGRLKFGHYAVKEDNGVTIGNKVIYQAVHNFGYPASNIPARPYMVVQPRDLGNIIQLFVKHLKG